MTFLEHLDELRSRLLRIAIAFGVAFLLCWVASGPILRFLLDPVRRHLFDGGDIIFIRITEPFVVYMKAAALASIFLSAPYVLWELWGFVAPGLYPRERRMGIFFILFGSVFFFLGGAFGYWIALPMTAKYLIGVGGDFKAALTLESAFRFESGLLLALGAVFQLPIVILFLSKLGVVTPAFLMRHFRVAVFVIVLAAAILTPTPDAMTMTVVAAPMILLYLLGVGVSWFFGRRETGT